MDDITDFNRILLLLKLEATFSGYKHSGGAVVEKEKKGTLFNSLKDSCSKGRLLLFPYFKNKQKKPQNLADVAYDERCVGCVLQFFRFRSCAESHH